MKLITTWFKFSTIKFRFADLSNSQKVSSLESDFNCYYPIAI